jgi:hypothetical protein
LIFNVDSTSPVTRVSGSFPLSFGVRAQVAGQNNVSYSVRSRVPGSCQLQFSVRTRVTGSVPIAFDVTGTATKVTGSFPLSWSVRRSIASSFIISYTVLSDEESEIHVFFEPLRILAPENFVEVLT